MIQSKTSRKSGHVGSYHIDTTKGRSTENSVKTVARPTLAEKLHFCRPVDDIHGIKSICRGTLINSCPQLTGEVNPVLHVPVSLLVQNI